MARVTKAFDGVPDGATQVRHFSVGEDVTGDLADVAIREGWAQPIGPRAAAISPDSAEHSDAPRPRRKS